MERIVTEKRSFVDEYGRERIFYGVNIVDKRKNSEDNKFGFNIDDKLLDEMTSRGLNEYLDDMYRIFDLCAAHGVYILFDMHQDLYSPRCYGDGAPDWATITDQYDPKEPKLVWAAGYFWGKATQRAFDNFWNNREYNGRGLIDYFAAMWQHVAARFADHPALFGFDMLNEPFLGSDGGKLFKKLISTAIGTVIGDKRVKCFKLVGDFLNKQRRDEVKYLEQITGDVLKDVTRKAGYEYVRKFDIEKYSPFINKVSTAIREVTDKGILVMENCYWSNTCIPCSTPAIFEEHVRTQDRLDAPVLVGEWGGFGGEGEDWLPHIEFLVNFFEQHKWGFTYWHYVDDMFDSPLMKVLSRPYPVAVSGRLISYGFDQSTQEFNLSYEGDGECTAPTEIYIHKPAKTVEGCEYELESVGENGAAKLVVKPVSGTVNVKITF